MSSDDECFSCAKIGWPRKVTRTAGREFHGNYDTI